MRPLSMLTLEPDTQIQFDGNVLEEKVFSNVTITNTTQDTHVAWKLRTTTPDSFLVAPRSGVLRPGECAAVVISLLPRCGSNFDQRFEVRAAAIAANCSVVSRADWAKWSLQSQERRELRAVVHGRGAGNNNRLRGSIEQRDSLNGAYEDPDANAEDWRQTAWRPERPRRTDLGTDIARRGGQVDCGIGNFTHSSEAASVFTGPSRNCGDVGSRGSGSETLVRRSTAAREEARSGVGLTGVSTSCASQQREILPDDTDSEKPPPMGPMTKAVLGLLIVVLIFNLYLRPLLDMALEGGSSRSSSSGSSSSNSNKKITTSTTMHVIARRAAPPRPRTRLPALHQGHLPARRRAIAYTQHLPHLAPRMRSTQSRIQGATRLDPRRPPEAVAP